MKREGIYKWKAWSRAKGEKNVGIHWSRQSAHRWRHVCQPYSPAALYPPETLFFCFWYSFLLEAEWTPGPSAAGSIRSIKKIHSHHRDSNPRPFGLYHRTLTSTLPRAPKYSTNYHEIFSASWPVLSCGGYAGLPGQQTLHVIRVPEYPVAT
jgi:hypothetical protein